MATKSKKTGLGLEEKELVGVEQLFDASGPVVEKVEEEPKEDSIKSKQKPATKNRRFDMTTAENSLATTESSVQESPGFLSKVTTRVGDAFGSLKEKAPTTEQVKGGISDGSTKVSGAYGQVKDKIGLKDYQKMVQVFKEWLPTLAEGDGLAKKMRTETKAATGWLAELSDEEIEAFARGLYAYCSAFNFDLAWLIDPEQNKIIDEQLKKTMEEIVLLYCLAAGRADQAQAGIKVFVNLQKWLDNPFDKQYEAFNRQLFTKLVAEDLIPAPSLELFLAPEKEREEYSVQAIKGLIAEDNERFYQILKAEVEVTTAEPVDKAGEEDTPSEAEVAKKP